MPEVDGPLTPFLAARAVAIVGASADRDRIGGRPLRYLLESGYRGRVYPINPTRSEVQGVPAFASLRDLPEVPELAIVAVSRDQAAAVIRDCADVGVRAATVFAAGYAETDEDGRAAQEELRAAALEGGVRLLGPNSNGTIAPAGGATFAFTPLLAEGLPPDGPLAIATQSAAVGTYWLRRLRERRLGMRAWVHTGNEADLGLGDVLAHCLADPEIRTVLCALEQWRRPADLDRLLDALGASDTELIVLPLGQSEVGRQAAISHTGGLLARRTNVVTGLLRQAGAHVVSGLEEALELAAALSVPLPRGMARVGILTTSGGLGVLLADAFSAAGFLIPELGRELQARLRDRVPFCSPRNPVDLTAQGVNQPELFALFAHDIVTSGDIDALAVFLPHSHHEDPLTLALIEAVPHARRHGVALIAIGSVPVDTAARLREHGISVFEEPAVAATVLRRLADRGPVGGVRPAVDAGAVAAEISRPAGGARTSDELSVKRLLAARGVDVVRDLVAVDPPAAADAADAVGYPVVVKILDPELAHKARAGGVSVGLRDRASVESAARSMLAAAADRRAAGRDVAGPPAQLLVEPFVAGDELFVAATRDANWGWLGLLGRGGVSVEARAGVAFRRLPVGRADIVSMLSETPSLAALFGLGRRAAGIDALARVFEVLETVARTANVAAIELNPVIVQPDGRCTVVDALVEWDSEAVTA